MRVIKNINNNVALCIDSDGREVIAFGKGIGFEKPPYELPLSRIERTFYDFKEMDFNLIKDIPVPVLKASMRIIDHLENYLGTNLMSTATLALADHINFAIQRKDQNMKLNLSIAQDIKHMYPDQNRYAIHSLDIIEEETGIRLDDEEASTIALHFINNQVDSKNDLQVINKFIIDESVKLIEQEFNIKIQTESFNYSRFVTHMEYLLQRSIKGKQIESRNVTMFESLQKEYPNAFNCALEIDVLFKKRLSIELSDEEILYLILHINRLCSREM